MSVDIESYRKRLIEDVSTIYKYCKTFSKKNSTCVQESTGMKEMKEMNIIYSYISNRNSITE